MTKYHSEKPLYSDILLTFSHGDTRLFRANCGQAWQGKIVQRSSSTITLAGYSLIKLLPPGFSDIFGFAGSRFVAIEGKRDNRFREGQREFLELVQRCGGLAGVARSVDDARSILDGKAPA